MRKIFEIRKDLSAKIAEVKALDPKQNAEAVENGLKEIEALRKELEQAQQIEAAEQLAADEQFNQMQKKAGRPFSIVKFFRELSSEKGLTGLEAEAAELGAKEYERLGLSVAGAVIPSAYLRAAAGQNAGTAADGGNLAETMSNRYVEQLKERLVIASLGATVLGDLVGTVPVITRSGITAAWGAEADSASVSKANFAKVTLTPHRNFVAGAVTKDLLKQTSADVEAMLLEMLLTAQAELIDRAAIAGTGSNGQPTGILNTTGIGSVVMGTNGGAITWPKVVALESTVNANNANRGKMAYLTNAKVVGDLKSTERASGNGRYLLDGDFKNLNGYPIDWTNLVPSNLTKGTASACSALIFGNFQDLFVGHWGGVDIVVDPYTSAKKAEVEFVLNSWDDIKVVEPKSFAAIKDLTTNA